MEISASKFPSEEEMKQCLLETVMGLEERKIDKKGLSADMIEFAKESSLLNKDATIITKELPLAHYPNVINHDDIIKFLKECTADPTYKSTKKYTKDYENVGVIPLLHLSMITILMGPRLCYIMITQADINKGGWMKDLADSIDECQEKIYSLVRNTPHANATSTITWMVVKYLLSNIYDYHHGNLETWWNSYRANVGCLLTLHESMQLRIVLDMYNAMHINCSQCQKKLTRTICGRCKWKRYCGKECQQEDWARHRKYCTEQKH